MTDFAQLAMDAGWNSQEVGALEWTRRKIPDLVPVIPDGPASLHRMHGDTLTALAAGEWPAVVAGSVVSLKRTWPTGRRERMVLSVKDSGYSLHVYAQGSGGWSARATAVEVPQFSDVIRTTPALGLIPPACISEYTVDISQLSSLEFGHLLGTTVDRSEDAGTTWPVELAGEWPESDEQLEELLPDAQWVHRWASVNGLRLSFVEFGSNHDKAPIPLLVNESEPEVVTQGEIARYSWFSESGGAPISWDGGASLGVITEGIGLSSVWGDAEENSHSLIELPSSTTGMAELLAGWIIGCDAEVAAAVALEPLDPDGTLTADEWERWDAHLSEVTISMDLDVPAETRRRAREILTTTSAPYARTRDALAHPTGVNGRVLTAVFDQVEQQGVIGELISGDWEGLGDET